MKALKVCGRCCYQLLHVKCTSQSFRGDFTADHSRLGAVRGKMYFISGNPGKNMYSNVNDNT